MFNTRSYALIKNSEGNLVYGEGPFTFCDEPPSSGVSFYLNNYDLTKKKPWLVPNSWRIITRNDLTKIEEDNSKKLSWKDPSILSFEKQFNDIKYSINEGGLKKTVPVVTSNAVHEDLESLFKSLIMKGANNDSPSYLYAFRNENKAFVGLSPEVLFEMDKTSIRTMALAGTSAETNISDFIIDKKEELEHRIVVESLRRRLCRYGAISESEKSTLNLGGILHFLTHIKVMLEHEVSISEVLKQIHPTPAVGTVPRVEKNIIQLNEFREDSLTPEFFAAPFGIKHDESFFSFIMIRGLFSDNNILSLPTGCGITKNSVLEDEWDELALKRHWVKNAFDL